MEIAIPICLLIFVLSFVFRGPIDTVIVSIANWINYKAGVKGSYIDYSWGKNANHTGKDIHGSGGMGAGPLG